MRTTVAYGAGVQQLPGFAVCIYGPTADNARIEEIETLRARPVDLPGLLADQHRLALVYGDLRWADLYPEWHSTPPWCSRRWVGRVPAHRVCGLCAAVKMLRYDGRKQEELAVEGSETAGATG
jgi:hypothetical protein